MIHELKTWPGPFNAVVSGEKRHEIRVSDRAFNEGDTLILREWDPIKKVYSGHSFDVKVTYVTRGGEWGIPDGLVVMSIVPTIDEPAPRVREARKP